MFFPNFQTGIQHATAALMKRGAEVDTGHWQGHVFENDPSLVTLELMDMAMEVPVDRKQMIEPGVFKEAKLSYPDKLSPVLAREIKPNLPWADDHFAERVSRDPSNPGEEYKNWPWWRGQEDQAMEEGATGLRNIFTHTYQERFWPKEAGSAIGDTFGHNPHPRQGIRYHYGDLDDVVNLLADHPYTRQATFPIFFPEDTGAVHGGRIPCTLHYHFMVRQNRLHLWYPIRSCDLVRHFRDDLYLACKLLLWVIQELQEKELRSDRDQIWVDVRPGTLFFNAYSFHVHKGDLHHVKV